MARIKESALVAGIRGSVGGNTFASGRGGAYVRQKVSPTQPRTSRQDAQRVIFSTCSKAWRNLTDANRNNWNVWASNHPVVDVFGNSQILSGMAAFMKVNAFLLTIGKAISSDPLADPTTPPPAPSSVAIVASTATATVTLAAAATADDIYVVFATRGLSAGVAFVNSDFRFAGRLTLTTPFTTSTLVLTDMNPLLNCRAGDKVGFKVVRCTQDGLIIDATGLSAVAS